MRLLLGNRNESHCSKPICNFKPNIPKTPTHWILQHRANVPWNTIQEGCLGLLILFKFFVSLEFPDYSLLLKKPDFIILKAGAPAQLSYHKVMGQFQVTKASKWVTRALPDTKEDHIRRERSLIKKKKSQSHVDSYQACVLGNLRWSTVFHDLKDGGSDDLQGHTRITPHCPALLLWPIQRQQQRASHPLYKTLKASSLGS